MQRFGDVDTSSAKSMFTSLRNSTANKSATPPSVAPPIPAAFGPKRGGFAPPPVRHVSPAPAPEPEPEPEPEEETAGEWAEALYDYSSAVRVSISSSYVSCCMYYGDFTHEYDCLYCYTGIDRSGNQSGTAYLGHREVFRRLVRPVSFIRTLRNAELPLLILVLGGPVWPMERVDCFRPHMSSSYSNGHYCLRHLMVYNRIVIYGMKRSRQVDRG